MDVDHQKLETMYQEIGPSLLGYFRQKFPQPGQAEDFLQETFLQAVKNPERLWQARNPKAYLFGIARHLEMQFFSDKSRQDQLAEKITLTMDTQDRMDARTADLRDWVHRLPDPFRTTVLLRIQQELSYEEIAAIMEVPVGTVRSRLHQAVQLLKQKAHSKISVL